MIMLCYYDLCNVLTSCQPGTTIWCKIGVYCILHFKKLSCNSLGNKSLFKNGAFQGPQSDSRCILYIYKCKTIKLIEENAGKIFNELDYYGTFGPIQNVYGDIWSSPEDPWNLILSKMSISNYCSLEVLK